MESMMMGMRPKRKEFEDAPELFADGDDFTVFSPAFKIRRLDSELAPMMGSPDAAAAAAAAIEQVVMNDVAVNEERAIVVYKQQMDPDQFLLGSIRPGGVSIRMPHNWFRQLNSKMLDQSMQNELASVENNNMAMVPWVPDQATTASDEVMDAEGAESTSMEIEEEKEQSVGGNAGFYDEGFHQWQQQHCMVPQQIPVSTASPVMW